MSGRRSFLASAAGLFAATGVGRLAHATSGDPFEGEHQAGIATPQQTQTYFAALDLTAKKPGEIVRMLRVWTDAAARLTRGQDAPDDSGEVAGLGAAGLTLTFGLGAGLFGDRYGLARRRPDALVDLPGFNGDQLVAERSGGDLSIQACADDPQVAFHAVRQLVRLADGVARVRWTQTGFLPSTPQGETPRNLMGFKDGTRNANSLADRVWVGEEGPGWMRGGSYVVVRKIRIALEHWDRTEVDFQEEVFGRQKRSGAPIGRSRERDTPDFEAMKPIPYSQARPKLRTGDILLFHSTGLGSLATEYFTHSLWCHAAFVWCLPDVQRVLLLESMDKIGVRVMPMSTRINGCAALTVLLVDATKAV